MDNRDFNFISDDKIPESIRANYVQMLAKQKEIEKTNEIEKLRIALEGKKFVWNTPIVAALAGLITLTASALFGLFSANQTASNAVTLEQVKSELQNSEKRLTQQLQEKSTKTAAELQSLAKEREFEYDIVKQELANPAKNNAQRAAVLLFLTRAGVLSTLKENALTDMATEQIKNPEKDIIPELTSQTQPPTVFGGLPVSTINWPWLVLLTLKGDYLCNGTLLGPKVVLTSATCVGEFADNARDLEAMSPGPPFEQVSLGGNSYTYRPAQGKAWHSSVVKIAVHPEYSDATMKNDIAVLILANDALGPFAKLSAKKETDPTPGAFALAAAFALDYKLRQIPQVLQARIPIVDLDVCRAKYNSPPGYIPDTEICAGFAEGGAVTCHGSGGGPLAVVDKKGEKYQVGIVSWSGDCGKPEYSYSVYTRVSAYVEWIQTIVSECCHGVELNRVQSK